MFYLIFSCIANFVCAVFAGFQFSHIFVPANDLGDNSNTSGGEKKGLPSYLRFSYALVTFAVPFFSPVGVNGDPSRIPTTIACFIALVAVSNIIVTAARRSHANS